MALKIISSSLALRAGMNALQRGLQPSTPLVRTLATLSQSTLKTQTPVPHPLNTRILGAYQPARTLWISNLLSRFQGLKVDEQETKKADDFLASQSHLNAIVVVSSKLHYKISSPGMHDVGNQEAYLGISSAKLLNGEPLKISRNAVLDLLQSSSVKEALKDMKNNEVRTLYIHPDLTAGIKLSRSLLIVDFKKTTPSETASSSSSGNHFLTDYMIYSTIFGHDPLHINPWVHEHKEIHVPSTHQETPATEEAEEALKDYSPISTDSDGGDWDSGDWGD